MTMVHAEPNDDHAEPQSSQSCLDTGKPVLEVLTPSTSADSASLREKMGTDKT